MTKKCSICKKTKSARLFYRDIQKTDGLTVSCRECRRKAHIEYYEYKRQERLEYANKYYDKNKEYIKQWHRKNRREVATKIISILGDKCFRCGESDKRILQVDHKNGGGRKHYKQKGGHYQMYKEILLSVEKSEGKYQLLCANCNLIEGIEKGYKKSIWI